MARAGRLPLTRGRLLPNIEPGVDHLLMGHAEKIGRQAINSGTVIKTWTDLFFIGIVILPIVDQWVELIQQILSDFLFAQKS